MLWPGRSAVGQRLEPVSRRPTERAPDRVVIGVVADTRYQALDRDPVATIYLPGAVGPLTYGTFALVKTTEDPADVIPRLLAIADAREARVDRILSVDDALFVTLKHRALPAWLFGGFGLAALAVVGAGVLGLIVMAVVRRRREIGVRCALGATPARVVRQIAREHARAVTAGLLLGVLASAAAVQGLRTQLYHTSPYDPWAWSLAGAATLAICVLAAAGPAWRAARGDLVQSLRVD
jgi:hypothetical protein